MALSTSERNRKNYLQKKESGYFEARLDELKLLIQEKLGNKCVTCGFNDSRALQIDHVNDDGCLERKGTRPNRRQRLRMILNDTDNRYQILCANCNWIKRAEHYKSKDIK